MNSVSTPRRSLFSGFNTPATRLEWLFAGAMAGKWVYDKYSERRDQDKYTCLKFSSDDAPYFWLMRWLENVPKSEKLGVYKVVDYAVDETDESKGRKASMVPTSGVRLKFQGVDVSVDKVEQSGSPILSYNSRPDIQLLFSTRNLEICEAFLKEIRALSFHKSVPRVYVHQSWGWSAVRKVPENRCAILPGRQLEKLVDDVRAFVGAEQWYTTVGLPFRRGYLLEGISGSGKTSAVISVASEFGMNVCSLALSSYDDDKLGEAVRQMPNNSILLLEDVDCAWTDLRDAKGKLTFSGLLNVIDGAATPEGRITFQTTNHRDKLDSALIRPGRVDYELNFTHATAGQIDDLALKFSPTAKGYGKKWSKEKLSMAQVQERLVRIYRVRQ